eukprot:COSAG05_NODE_6736_length_911_cov_1.326355_1_plen_212_part_01
MDLRSELQAKIESGLTPLPDSHDSEEERGTVGYWCDVCVSPIPRSEDWFHCSECEGFDVCLGCHQKHGAAGVHEHFCWREVALALRKHPQEDDAESTTCCELVLHAFRVYKDRWCMGLAGATQMESGVAWLTYQQVERRVRALACSLHAELRAELGAESFVGICSENCIEWLLTDLSCILAGCPTIPIDPPTAEAAIRAIIGDCELRVVFCS